MAIRDHLFEHHGIEMHEDASETGMHQLHHHHHGADLSTTAGATAHALEQFPPTSGKLTGANVISLFNDRRRGN